MPTMLTFFKSLIIQILVFRYFTLQDNIEKIIYGAAERIKINIEQNAVEMIARYAKNGRDAVKILQMAKNIIFLDNRRNVTLDDIAWILKTCHYTNGYISSDEKIIDISVIKPK